MWRIIIVGGGGGKRGVYEVGGVDGGGDGHVGVAGGITNFSVFKSFFFTVTKC